MNLFSGVGVGCVKRNRFRQLNLHAMVVLTQRLLADVIVGGRAGVERAEMSGNAGVCGPPRESSPWAIGDSQAKAPYSSGVSNGEEGISMLLSWTPVPIESTRGDTFFPLFARAARRKRNAGRAIRKDPAVDAIAELGMQVRWKVERRRGRAHGRVHQARARGGTVFDVRSLAWHIIADCAGPEAPSSFCPMRAAAS